jgi:hypothetical protein
MGHAHLGVGEFLGAPTGRQQQFQCHSTKTLYYVPVAFFDPSKVKNADQLPSQTTRAPQPKPASWPMRDPRRYIHVQFTRAPG